MRTWIKNRAVSRKNGRLVFVTSVAFDAHVYDELCSQVRERYRSAVVTEALRCALATPGWLDGALARISGKEVDVEAPRARRLSNSHIHAIASGSGEPETRRSPSSRPPRSKGPVSSSKPTPR